MDPTDTDIYREYNQIIEPEIIQWKTLDPN